MKWIFRLIVSYTVATIVATVINVGPLKKGGDIYSFAEGAGNALFSPIGIIGFPHYQSAIVRRERLQAAEKRGFGNEFTTQKGFDRQSERNKATIEALFYAVIMTAAFWIPFTLLKRKVVKVPPLSGEE